MSKIPVENAFVQRDDAETTVPAVILLSNGEDRAAGRARSYTVRQAAENTLVPAQPAQASPQPVQVLQVPQHAMQGQPLVIRVESQRLPLAPIPVRRKNRDDECSCCDLFFTCFFLVALFLCGMTLAGYPIKWPQIHWSGCCQNESCDSCYSASSEFYSERKNHKVGARRHAEHHRIFESLIDEITDVTEFIFDKLHLATRPQPKAVRVIHMQPVCPGAIIRQQEEAMRLRRERACREAAAQRQRQEALRQQCIRAQQHAREQAIQRKSAVRLERARQQQMHQMQAAQQNAARKQQEAEQMHQDALLRKRQKAQAKKARSARRE